MTDHTNETPSPPRPEGHQERVLVDVQHPWLGLLPFRPEHRDYFFGRDTEISEIVHRINENSLTVIYGQSGLGKSSLLGAGVLPKLEATGFSPVLLRLSYTASAPPLLAQTHAALRATRLGTPWPDDAEGLTLWELFHRLPLLALPGTGVPVLLFDQFEEIFTLARLDPVRRAEAADWMEQMADLLQNRPPKALEQRFAETRRLARDYDFDRSPLRVVFALREDYLSSLEEWKIALPLLTQNRMAVHLLNGQQALEAVLGPASMGDAPLLDRHVALAIVRTVARVSTETPIGDIKAVPPLLSLLCEQLNAARLTAAAPEITADMVSNQSEDILQRFYQESFDPFPEEHGQVIRSIIEDPPMITEGGYRNSIVREDAEAQLRRAGLPNPSGVFDFLIQRRLITVEERDRIQRLEITHDVLVPLLTRSRRERNERMAREAVERRKADEDIARQQAEQTKRRRHLLIAMAGLTLIAIVQGVVGWILLGKAAADRDEAQHGQGLALTLRSQASFEQGKWYPESLLYAAQAIGFDGLKSEGEPGKVKRLLQPERDETVYEETKKWISERPAYLPIWASSSNRLSVTGMALSASGRWLVRASADGHVVVWDLSKGEEHTAAPPGSPVAAVDIDPFEQTLVIASRDRLIRWNLTSKALESEQSASASALAWGPGGDVLVAAASDGRLVLWRDSVVETLQTGFSSPAHRIDFSADNSRGVAVWSHQGVRVVFPHAKALAGAWAEHKDDSTAVAISPDATTIAIGHQSGGISLYKSIAPVELARLGDDGRHKGAVLDLAFSPDGSKLASASADGSTRLWKVVGTSFELLASLGMTSSKSAVSHVQFASDGDLLAVAAEDGSVRLWWVGGRVDAPLDLYGYLGREFIAIDATTQLAGWGPASGFFGVPSESLVGLWQKEGQLKVAEHLMDRQVWGMAGRLGADPNQVCHALVSAAERAAAAKHWNLVERNLLELRAACDTADRADIVARLVPLQSRPKLDESKPRFTAPNNHTMIYCPPTGAEGFQMGSPIDEEGRNARLETQHKVVLTQGFWIAQHEVTQAQWRAIMETNPSVNQEDSGALPSEADPSDENASAAKQRGLPVENVTWYEAVAYCRRLTDLARGRGLLTAEWEYALPTEAQWEYACRAGSTTPFSLSRVPDSDKEPEQFQWVERTQTDRVGRTAANSWDLHDMHGNVAEWCQDSFDPRRPDYPAGDAVDPLSTEGENRVGRNGGYAGPLANCRSAYRNGARPNRSQPNLGFRIALVRSRRG